MASKTEQTAGKGKSILRVAALVHPRVLATSVSLPLEILKAAAESSKSRPRLTVASQLISKKGEPLQLIEGFTLQTVSRAELKLPDILIIPAIWRNPRWVLHHEEWQLDVIRRCIDHGSWVACVGTGSFLLAASGAMEHRAATTHWHWLDDFERHFPAVRLRRDQLITQSSHLFCVGSVNSVADLMVYLCSQLFSSTTARTIENQFSPEIRRRFAPHEFGREGDSHTDEKVMDGQLALNERLSEPLDLNGLARSLGVSTRTLNRRFREATGVTPGTYLTQRRIEEARTLLMDTNLSIAEIGWQVGYRDPSRFTQHFKRHAGVTPRQYRAATRGKRFEVPKLSEV